MGGADRDSPAEVKRQPPTSKAPVIVDDMTTTSFDGNIAAHTTQGQCICGVLHVHHFSQVEFFFPFLIL